MAAHTGWRWPMILVLGLTGAAVLANPHGATILRGHRDVVCALAWSPDGRRLASGTPNMEDGVRLWDRPAASRSAQSHPAGVVVLRGGQTANRSRSPAALLRKV
jgi:hypothetical protein